MLSEERNGTIASQQELLKATESNIRLKQLRMNNLRDAREFQKCDEVNTELRELLKEKAKIESLLAVLQKKEKKAQWYKKKNKHAKKDGPSLPELLRRQSSSSSRASDESGDTVILDNSSPDFDSPDIEVESSTGEQEKLNDSQYF